MKKIIDNYFKESKFTAPEAHYKIIPKTLIEHFCNWLKDNDYIIVKKDKDEQEKK